LVSNGKTDGRIQGKRAIVTGAGSGIGRAISLRFAHEGAAVGVLDVDVASAETTAEAIRADGGDALVLPADVTNEEQVAGAVDDAVARWGGLDVIVTSAAVQLFGEDRRVDQLELETWNRTLSINLTGAFLTCKHGVKALLASGGGSVVLIGSPTGLFGLSPDCSAYSVSKAGSFGLARVLASGYAGDGIRANVVLPGFTNTPLVTAIMNDPVERDALVSNIPLGRPGTADEVASMVLFLASDESAYATGGVFTVDGGVTAI
jgi:NAD(P)-dependent dehydrogenase (short-subunit alcohol dehydrogenase family)